jgi:hypothetical protein
MPNWKKVLLSGSKAAVYDITASNLPYEGSTDNDVVVLDTNGHLKIANREDVSNASGPLKAVQFAYSTDGGTTFKLSGSSNFTFEEDISTNAGEITSSLTLSGSGEAIFNLGREGGISKDDVLGVINFIGTGSNHMEGPSAVIRSKANNDFGTTRRNGRLEFLVPIGNGPNDYESPQLTISESIVSSSVNVLVPNLHATNDITASNHISASNNIYASAYYVANTASIYSSNDVLQIAIHPNWQTLELGRSGGSTIVKSHLTASKNISASGHINTFEYRLENTESLSLLTNTIALGKNLDIEGVNISRPAGHTTILSHLTASKDISGSGMLFVSLSLEDNTIASQTVMYDTSSGKFYFTGSYGGGGGAEVAGNNTEVQFNDNGSLGANSNVIINSLGYLGVGQRIFHIGNTSNFINFGTDTIHMAKKVAIGDDNTSIPTETVLLVDGQNQNSDIAAITVKSSATAFGHISHDANNFSIFGRKNVAIGTTTLINDTNQGNVAIWIESDGLTSYGNNARNNVAIGSTTTPEAEFTVISAPGSLQNNSTIYPNQGFDQPSAYINNPTLAGRVVAGSGTIPFKQKVLLLELNAQEGANNYAELIANQKFIEFRAEQGVCGALRRVSNGPTSITIDQTSDKRLKTNIENLNSGLDTLLKIKPREFNWKDNINAEKSHGFIAQELHKVYPSAVFKPTKHKSDPKKDPWTVSMPQLIPLLVNSIQEQQQIINDLEKRIKKLEKTQS